MDAINITFHIFNPFFCSIYSQSISKSFKGFIVFIRWIHVFLYEYSDTKTECSGSHWRMHSLHKYFTYTEHIVPHQTRSNLTSEIRLAPVRFLYHMQYYCRRFLFTLIYMEVIWRAPTTIVNFSFPLSNRDEQMWFGFYFYMCFKAEIANEFYPVLYHWANAFKWDEWSGDGCIYIVIPTNQPATKQSGSQPIVRFSSANTEL